jgi:hypothetical protein
MHQYTPVKTAWINAGAIRDRSPRAPEVTTIEVNEELLWI